MKNLKLYLLSISLSILFFSACSEKNNPIEDVHLSGVITNQKADNIAISSGEFNEKAMLDSTGNFDFKIALESGFYTLKHGRESASIFLRPGDNLKITLDAKQFDESLKFEGPGSKVNNYLAAKYLKMESFTSKTKDDYSADESMFSETMKSYESELLQLLSQSELDDEFVNLEDKNIKFKFIDKRMDYEVYHRYYTSNNDFNVTEEFAKEFADLDFKNEKDYKSIPSYKVLVNNHFIDGEVHETLKKLKETSSPVIKDNIIKNLTKWLSPGTDELKSVVTDLKGLTTDTAIINSLHRKYEEMKDLEKGNDSPGFNFADVNGNKINLNNLKGKNIYIDVWATWCGPCKREIPHLKELESQYHDKNIEFVSISVDVPKDEQKWKDMVKEKELKGVQLISDNGWDTEFVNEYLIKGIPRFILLDDQGKIVSADAPRPSSGEKIKGMIESLSI